MIRIYPDIEITIKCNSCNMEFIASSFHLTGMHALCSGICSQCNEELYKEMPTSAGLIYPIIVRKRDALRVDDLPFSNWYINNLPNAFRNRNNDDVIIEKKINSIQSKESLLILNTIDQTYGHSVFNLFNYSYYKRKSDFHILLIVQKNLLWLVPEGVDEVWVVDIPFSKGGLWYTRLSAEVNETKKKYRCAYLCRLFPQAPDDEFRIEDYSHVKPFPLEEWDARLTKPTITFIWRTDRFWKHVLPRHIDNRYTRKLFPHALKKLRSRLQFSWILKFARELRSKIPSVDFAIAGMDTREYELPEWIKDYRFAVHHDEEALLLCKRYAESHLVIGCNGSSLVLPSCHAGGVINIVPSDGWAVSVGSFFFRYTSIADTFYRYSLVHSETSIERIVKIAVQILRDRSMVQLISGSPWNDHEADKKHEDWAVFRRKIFMNTQFFNEQEGMISR